MITRESWSWRKKVNSVFMRVVLHRVATGTGDHDLERTQNSLKGQRSRICV